MIIVFHPRVGHKLLHAGIKRRRARKRKAKQGRITASHVVEMHDMETPPAHSPHQKHEQQDRQQGKEPNQVHVAERVDKRRNGIIGNGRREQIRLVNPPHGVLVTSHFHPHRVHRIFRHNHDVGHHQAVVFEHRDTIRPGIRPPGIMVRMGGMKAQAVPHDQEIEILRIMMGCLKV